MNRSPLHEVNASLGARFVDFGGWEMPLRYDSVLTEHRAVRDSAGFFDVTHLGRFQLTGIGAKSALGRLLSNDLGRIAVGETQYTLMLDDDGGIIDDLLVWWWDENEFWVLPNAANHREVMDSFAGQPDCVVTDLQSATVMIAVQGPAAPEVLEEVVGGAPRRFHTLAMKWRGHTLHMAGTGYTGEPGGEVCTSGEAGAELIGALVATGVTPCGLGARDTLRLEAGLPLWGEDMDRSTTALEANLGFAAPAGRDFVGSEALMIQREEGVQQRLCAFALSSRGIPRHGYSVRSGSSNGAVTSGNLSPILGDGIGLAYMSPPLAVGDALEVEIRSKWLPGRVLKPPFHKS